MTLLRTFKYILFTILVLSIFDTIHGDDNPSPTANPNIRYFSTPSCSATTYRIYASSFVSILHIVLYTFLFLASVIYVRYLCHQSITTDTVKDY
ncbi:envelope glycoprotein N [Proboscivirus elephantidbeta5]|uniref:Envelope glycoprotein N n=1 Tax=Elephant endotheliotropic herpesvirus 5 TaxID=768738 RepID=A0A075CZT6_9BETA|nr:envelope glycoprotein N [Elephant endotheliotropic herpesvirus 5]AHC02849.1 envelope glycoprotein N [Elephant endotheliotropic herpesvirus 5]